MKGNSVLQTAYILLSLMLHHPANSARIGKKSIILPQDDVTEQVENRDKERGLSIRSVSTIPLRNFCGCLTLLTQVHLSI